MQFSSRRQCRLSVPHNRGPNGIPLNRNKHKYFRTRESLWMRRPSHLFVISLTYSRIFENPIWAANMIWIT